MASPVTEGSAGSRAPVQYLGQSEMEAGSHYQNSVVVASTSCTDLNSRDPFNALLSDLQYGQFTTQAALNANGNIQNTMLGQLTRTPEQNSASLGQLRQLNSLSWLGPQIYLQSASSGKSVPKHYEITDYIVCGRRDNS